MSPRMRKFRQVWQPTGPATVHKELSELGFPWFSTVLGLGALGLAGFAMYKPVLRWLEGGHVDTGRFWIGVAGLAVGLFLAWFAISRVRSEPDALLGIDPQGRKLVRMDFYEEELADGLVIPFDQVQALTLSSRQRVHRFNTSRGPRESRWAEYSVVCLPQDVRIFKSRSPGKTTKMANRLATLLGVELRPSKPASGSHTPG